MAFILIETDRFFFIFILMENLFSYILVAVIISALYFVITYYFLRRVFEVEKIKKNNEKQLEVLMKMAERLGVTENEIYELKYRK